MIFIMARSFKEAIQHRRTHYGIGNNSPISDNEIHEIIKTAVTPRSLRIQFAVYENRTATGVKATRSFGKS